MTRTAIFRSTFATILLLAAPPARGAEGRIDLRLDRFVAVLDTLGLRKPPYEVITVAGTNGKGSCVAMLESIYWHAGYDVGTFTSPHLWRFNERIRFNGNDAGDAELVEVFEEAAAARRRRSSSRRRSGAGRQSRYRAGRLHRRRASSRPRFGELFPDGRYRFERRGLFVCPPDEIDTAQIP